MKKLIITAAIALTASLSFYTYQSQAVSETKPVTAENLIKNIDKSDFNPVRTNRMDVGQADIK